MTYIVLARKWRPQLFSDLIGQEAIARTLENAIKLEKVPHAILFTGTRGVGKTTSARLLAKALNCEKGPSIKPCNECSNCSEISSGTSMDVLEIDGASNTSVDDVRELRETVRYAPSKSRHKIYIIDEVHMLSSSAFNALLKTLEEPPSGVIFIFATTEPQKIPETIHSRCQRFDFKQVSDAEIAKHLKKIIDVEKIALGEESLKLIARQAFGSVRDALSLLEQVVAFCGGLEKEITQNDVAAILGLTDRALILKTMECFASRDATASLEVLAEVFSKGYDPKTYLEEIWEKVRDLVVWKATREQKLMSSGIDEIERMKAWAEKLDQSELERWFDLLKYTCQEVSRVQFPRYLMEVTFLKITKKEQRVPISQLLDRLEKLEKSVTSSAPVRTDHKVAAPISQEPFVVAPAQTEKKTSSPDWALLLETAKKQKPAISAILLQAQVLEMVPGKLRLGFPQGSFYIERARDKDFQKFLTDLTEQLFGQIYRVDIEASQALGAPVTEGVNNPGTLEGNRKMEKDALENPMVKKAISMFQAKVEDIKPIK